MKLTEEILDILVNTGEASLGTIENGRPYVSAVGYVYRPVDNPENCGHLYLLLSDLARHARNLVTSSPVSLLVIEKKSGIPVHELRRMSLQGRAARIRDAALFESLRSDYIKQFPRSEMFFQLPDFRFYQVTIDEVHWIGGFGKAGTFK